jgi:hypothetical protein
MYSDISVYFYWHVFWDFSALTDMYSDIVVYRLTFILTFQSIFDISVYIDWLIIYCFTSRSRNFSLIWRRHHCRWRAAKFRPMLGAQGLWAGRDLYCATPAVTRDLCFSGLIQRTAPFSRLLRHTRGGGEGSILTRILTRSFQCIDWHVFWHFNVKLTCILTFQCIDLHVFWHFNENWHQCIDWHVFWHFSVLIDMYSDISVYILTCVLIFQCIDWHVFWHFSV